MLENVPNFHRWVDGSAKKRLFIKPHKTFILFIFVNKDETGVREIIMKSHRPLKFLKKIINRSV